MAKRVTLNQAFADPDEDAAAEVAAGDQEQEPTTPKKAASKRPAAGKRGAAKKATAGKSGRRPKEGATPRAAAKELPVWASDEVVVRATDTKSTKPFNVALHPEDLQALDMAKIQTGYGDRQARIRTMVALWRGDPEFREAVEERAKNAPRGSH